MENKNNSESIAWIISTILMISIIIIVIALKLNRDELVQNYAEKMDDIIRHYENKIDNLECYAELDYYTPEKGFVVRNATTNNNIASILFRDGCGNLAVITMSKIEG